MFWTIDPSRPGGTLCEECALSASNLGFAIVGLKPATSMEEVGLIFDTLAAMGGKGDVPTPLTFSEFGRCYNEAACHTPAVIPNEVA